MGETMSVTVNPDCKICKGSGWVETDEYVKMNVCICVKVSPDNIITTGPFNPNNKYDELFWTDDK
jgi:hypothetical protein